VVRGLSVFAVFALGCYQPKSTLECDDLASCTPVSDGAVDGDAVDDGPINDDAGPGELCAGTSNGLIGVKCFIPGADVVFDVNDTFNTDTDGRCDTTENTACFVVGNSIVVNASATLDALGMRPLVLWSATTIVISGTVDASSRSGVVKLGSGANTTMCGALDGEARIDISPQPGGGGTGASYRGGGGGGGRGRSTNGNTTALGGPVGVSIGLRGGCAGGNGGHNLGSGGNGGGAVYLMAGASIQVTGVINASGAGGGTATSSSTQRPGGGGGGSGGLIGLEAPTINVTNARLISLGGGGASGGGDFDGAVGQKGGDPVVDPVARGAGGIQSAPANSGGAGAAGDCSIGTGGNVMAGITGGGGGGGGGCGYIKAFGTVTGTAIATAPTLD